MQRTPRKHSKTRFVWFVSIGVNSWIVVLATLEDTIHQITPNNTNNLNVSLRLCASAALRQFTKLKMRNEKRHMKNSASCLLLSAPASCLPRYSSP
jgi:hypothetical protein